MTTRLRTIAIGAGLLVLISHVAWAQPYPTTDSHGMRHDRVARGDSMPPPRQASVASASGIELDRLPSIANGGPVVDVASANLGGPRQFTTDTPLIAEPCYDCQAYVCACEPHWVMSADLLWMSRSRSNPRSLIESPLGGVVTSESFNARELLFDARAGFRASWGYDMLDGRAVELTAVNVYDQRATADVADTDMFFTFHGLSPAVASDAYTINYVSNLHSGELNWWLGEAWGIRPMIGARWIRVREEFSMLDTTNTSWDAFAEMQNDLIGAQIGLKTCLWNQGNWFRVEAAMKSGVYHNDIDYHAHVNDAAGASQGTLDRDPSATSFVGELTVSAVVQFCPRLAMRFGYHGLWMAEIALAPNQVDQSDMTTGSGTDHLGSLNYQGGFFGLEGNW